MTLKFNVLTAICVTLLYGCSTQVTQDVLYKNMVKIPVKTGDAKVTDKMVDHVKEYKYVKLETNKESLIGDIDKMRFFKENILILDKKSMAIFVFDTAGKFITKIRKVGNGPGEYTGIFDFDIDGDGNIYALDIYKNMIYKYDLKGKYLSSRKLNHFAKNMAVVDSSTLLTFHPFSIDNTTPLGELVVTRNNQVINSFLPLKEDRLKGTKATFLKPYTLNHSERILYNKDLSDTIFEVSKDGLNLKAKYALDFGSKTISPEQRSKPDLFHNNPITENKGWNIENYFENSDFFSCSFNMDGKTWVLYYNKKDKTYTYTSCASCGTSSPKIISSMVVKGVSNDYFVSMVIGGYLKEYQSYFKRYPDKEKEFSQDNASLIKGYNENDNPILVMYKM